MLRRRPEGIILTAGKHTEKARKMMLNSGIPIIEFWDMPEKPLDRIVGFSNKDAMRLLVRQLAQKGYQRFAFIGGATNYDTSGLHLLEGFRQELQSLGLESSRVISHSVPPSLQLCKGEGLFVFYWSNGLIRKLLFGIGYISL